MQTIKAILTTSIILSILYGIGYLTSPKVEYIVTGGEKMVISVDGKQVYRPLSLTDQQEAILIEVK